MLTFVVLAVLQIWMCTAQGPGSIKCRPELIICNGKCKNGECELINLLRCTTKCTCTEGFTGSTCETPLGGGITASPNVTVSPNVTESTSPTPLNYTVCRQRGLKCYNGNCDKSGYLCKCEDGWGGRTCNMKCPDGCCDTTNTCDVVNGIAKCKVPSCPMNDTHYTTGLCCNVTMMKTTKPTTTKPTTQSTTVLDSTTSCGGSYGHACAWQMLWVVVLVWLTG